MKEYILVHLIDKRPVGTNVGKSIPLHLTVVPWFEFGGSLDDLMSIIETKLSKLEPMEVVAETEDFFGPKKNVAVMKLRNDPKLLDLHKNMLNTLEQLGVKVKSRWIGEGGWSPHVTHKQGSRLHQGIGY